MSNYYRSLILFLILLPISLFSQHDYYAEFLRIDNLEENGNDTIQCKYINENNQSYFYYDYNIIDKTTSYFDEENRLRGDIIKKRKNHYKDFSIGKMYSDPDILYLTNAIIEEEIDSFVWEIDESKTKEILGYSCTYATTSYKGRKYEVYFAPEIPINDGPWKFNGLPGMILEVKGRVNYQANKLIVNNAPELKINYKPDPRKILNWDTAIREANINYNLLMKQIYSQYNTDIHIDTSKSIEVYKFQDNLVQDSYCLDYKYYTEFKSNDIKNDIESVPNYSRLCTKNYQSTFYDLDRIDNSQPSNSRYTIFLTNAKYNKDLSNKTFIKEEEINGKLYSVKDTIPNFNWVISRNEFKNIQGYNCTKAFTVTDDNKYQITVWYTSDIPIPDGPLLYYGLPGMILEVEEKQITESSSQINRYEIIEIKKNGKNFELNKLKPAESYYTSKEFDELEKEIYNKQFELENYGVDKD